MNIFMDAASFLLWVTLVKAYYRDFSFKESLKPICLAVCVLCWYVWNPEKTPNPEQEARGGAHLTPACSIQLHFNLLLFTPLSRSWEAPPKGGITSLDLSSQGQVHPAPPLCSPWAVAIALEVLSLLVQNPRQPLSLSEAEDAVQNKQEGTIWGFFTCLSLKTSLLQALSLPRASHLFSQAVCLLEEK